MLSLCFVIVFSMIIFNFVLKITLCSFMMHTYIYIYMCMYMCMYEIIEKETKFLAYCFIFK